MLQLCGLYLAHPLITFFIRETFYAAKRPVRKTWGKPKKTKENPTTKTRERENVFSCFCSVYFPLVSEKSS